MSNRFILPTVLEFYFEMQTSRKVMVSYKLKASFHLCTGSGLSM